jgi:hypothetical protein
MIIRLLKVLLGIILIAPFALFILSLEIFGYILFGAEKRFIIDNILEYVTDFYEV